LPPLRERREDVPVLAQSLLARLETGRARTLSSAAIDCLARHDFPGNVRELRNVLERASLLADGDTIDVEHLPPEVRAAAGAAQSSPPLREAERQALQEALASHAGSRRDIARALGISERTLYRKLRQHGLK